MTRLNTTEKDFPNVLIEYSSKLHDWANFHVHKASLAIGLTTLSYANPLWVFLHLLRQTSPQASVVNKFWLHKA